MSSSIRVAIIGGGVGGMSAAAFLQRAGIPAQVYEQASGLKAVGAGLVVSPNAIRLIRRLGTMDLLEHSAVALHTGWQFRRWQDGRILSSQAMGEECRVLYGENSYVAHRADLLSALVAAVDPASIHLGSRCLGVRDSGDEVVVDFADGSYVIADLVIGADGVHSTVGHAVTEMPKARFSKIAAYRCLVPVERAPEFARTAVQNLWLGPDKHLVHYPICAGRMINVVAFVPEDSWQVESWSAEGKVSDLVDSFADWEPELVDLLQAAPSAGHWALFERDSIDRWVRGRIALLGDAAHPMFPFFAQGAAQAIEDAAALACAVSDQVDVEKALRQYEDVRITRATRIQQMSYARKETNHLPDGPAQVSRDEDFRRADPLRDSGWLYGHDAELA